MSHASFEAILLKHQSTYNYTLESRNTCRDQLSAYYSLINHSLPGERHVAKLQLPRQRLCCQEIPHRYQVWEDVMGGRSFSRESEWIEATPGGGRLPGEE